jgi:hypothetical protein
MRTAPFDRVETSSVQASRHELLWVHVTCSTALVQLQFRQSIVHGDTHVTNRHAICVVPEICVLHCPYRNTLQHVERWLHFWPAQWHPFGQDWLGRRLQSR